MARIASMKNSEFVRRALEGAAVVRKGPPQFLWRQGGADQLSGGARFCRAGQGAGALSTLAPRPVRDHVSGMEPRAVFRLCYVALVARNGRSSA
mgnify:CR=1 FL=1